jgi:CubicO group peptidase (beta-lactamase class C family)
VSELRAILEDAVASGAVPGGAAALVARDGAVEIESAGELEPTSIVRIASITKPITAAAVMLLVDDGVVALDDLISRWLPELSSPSVVRTPASAVDDVVPAARSMTVDDLLTFRAGWGFPPDFTLPVVGAMFEKLPVFGIPETPDAWLHTLASVPLVNQPGEAWLYNTCSDIQGVLVARASGKTLPDFLAERIFLPLGMTDTAFHVPAEELGRLAPLHGPVDGDLWTTPPVFPSGAGGLVSTLADWHRFADMLLADGGEILSPASVRAMTSDHITREQRDASTVFLGGAGWGYGGSVGPGTRYGWVGGTGTTAHIDASTRTVALLFTQAMMPGPEATPLMRAFWQYAF